jgi:hypothetical protein
LIGGNCEIPNAALQEIPGECRLRADDQLGRLGPAADFPEQGAQAAEVILVRAFVGACLGDGETEHV